MNTIQVFSFIITLTAIFSYLNYRYFKLPTSIGVMLISLLMSLVLIGLGKLGLTIVVETAENLLIQIDFNKTLMQGMLSFLLFAGALHINLNDLIERKYIIASLATGGVIFSTIFYGAVMYFVFNMLGFNLNFLYCLLFGSLISPTDPIAVLGVLKSGKVPRSLTAIISGESLFNDGVGVVVFTILFEMAAGDHPFEISHVGLLFMEEAVGGILFGFLLGLITYRLLKTVDDYQVEVLITLALVMGGYSLASAIHTSGPISIVVAGLFIGNHGRRFAMSEKSRLHLDTFWELMDGILNSVLFVLIGLEILLISFSSALLTAGIIAIPILLLVRWSSVGLPVLIVSRWRSFTPGAITIMTWGGLRGGISVALVLSLPVGDERQILLAITYIIVLFSIVVQGLTIKHVVSRLMTKFCP